MTDLPPPSSTPPDPASPNPASTDPTPFPSTNPPPAPGRSPWWRKKFAKVPVWGWLAIGVVLLGIAASAGGGDTTDSNANSPAMGTDDAESESSEVQSTTTSTTTTTTAETTTTEPGFGSGVLLVGVDIQPGIYASTTPASSFGCYWARLSDLSGDFEAILANDNIASEAQALVEILPTDEAFESNGCGRWVAPELADPPRTEFGEGAWIVNGQIAPGRYRSTGPGPDDFSCYWARLSGLSGDFDSIIANSVTEGPTVVDISPTDIGFETSGCGDWSLVE